MKESYICNTLYSIFDYEIPLEEIRSFMYFLKGCGAYDKYINNLNINLIKDNINKNNKPISYYELIVISFVWNKTDEGTYYWAIINDLHHIIIHHKASNNKFNFKDLTIDRLRLKFPKLFYNIVFDDIATSFNACNKKDKKLNLFISNLKEYCKENNLL